MNVIGDVTGKRAIIVDDEIDTGGTLIEVVRALEREGVTEMYACATHGVLSDPAVDRIRDSALREVVITDSIPLPAAKRIPKLTVLSVAPLIGEAIKRIHRGESVGALFSSEVSFTQEMLLWEEAGAPTRSPAAGNEAWSAATSLAGRCTIDGPMTLRLHRPDGEGGLEPRPVTDQDWRNQLRSPRWGAGLRRRPPAGAAEPRDEPDLAAALGAVLARPRVRHLRPAGRRLRLGILELGQDRSRVAVAPRRGSRGRSARILTRPMRLLSRFVDSNDREIRRHPAVGRRGQRLEAEFEALSDEEIRAQFAEIRDGDPELAVDG